MVTYQRLESPKLYANFLTQTISDAGVLSDGSLADPDTTIKAIIEDSTGTVVQALANMTKDATGKYSYAGYTIPSSAKTGVWNWEARGDDTGGMSIGRSSFIVEEEVA